MLGFFVSPNTHLL